MEIVKYVHIMLRLYFDLEIVLYLNVFHEPDYSDLTYVFDISLFFHHAHHFLDHLANNISDTQMYLSKTFETQTFKLVWKSLYETFTGN